MTKPDVANEAYGPNQANVFDLWLAKSDKPAPLLVFIHGGGFMGGAKKDYNVNLLKGCLQAGISFGAIEYRLSGVAKYPAQMHDCARALQYIRHNAAKWNLDPKRIASTGGSAGAGISLWLAFHDDMADAKAEDPVARESTRISCAIVTAAQCTYDPRQIKQIVPGNAFNHLALKQLHGLPQSFNWDKDPIDEKLDAMLKDCSPITFLTKDDAPVYVLHNVSNEKDGDIHHPNFGKHLETEMQKLGIECVRRLDSDYAKTKTMFSTEALEFLKKHFGMAAEPQEKK